jgi:hypothetical protein
MFLREWQCKGRRGGKGKSKTRLLRMWMDAQFGLLIIGLLVDILSTFIIFF